MSKKIILIILLAFILTGCFNTSQSKNEEEETSAANKLTDVLIVINEPPLKNWGISGGKPASEVNIGFKIDV
jgi:PBP1b-binding outer membrane lipoprotein LpoB